MGIYNWLSNESNFLLSSSPAGHADEKMIYKCTHMCTYVRIALEIIVQHKNE